MTNYIYSPTCSTSYFFSFTFSLFLFVHYLFFFFFFSSRRRHTRYWRDWSSALPISRAVPRLTVGAGPTIAPGHPIGRPGGRAAATRRRLCHGRARGQVQGVRVVERMRCVRGAAV